MNLTNYYWYFKSALTPKFCDEVIALTGGYEKKQKLNKEEIKNLQRKR